MGSKSHSGRPDIALSGDDALLLNDALVTHSLGLDTCLYLTGLQNGTYEVLTYMWMPNHPEVIHKSKYDTVPGQQTTTGAWTAAHALGVSFTRTFVNVSNGFMGHHMGLFAGQDPVLGGAVNGMQLRLIECDISNFCSSTPNSAGFSASIASSGTCSVILNDFQLSASPTPNTMGLFFYSQTWINGGAGVPFGQGRGAVAVAGSFFHLRVLKQQ